MLIQRKVLNNVSFTAHPQGCRCYVEKQVSYVENRPKLSHAGPKRVLVVGGSTGYGLASRIVAAFACGADTINVSVEREGSENKTGTPGWYGTKAFEQLAGQKGLKAHSIFGDAFSNEVKEHTAALIEQQLGQIDLLVYSLASPKRTDPVTGQVYSSVLKPIGSSYSALSVDLESGIVKQATIEPATDTQIEETVKVMGGEDWSLWVEYLLKRNLLSPHFTTVAYSYIGPQLTYPVYREGTIGRAKAHLEATASRIKAVLQDLGGSAYVSVNKALVTRASAVIPVVPLYMSLLYQVMKEHNLHETCIEQIYRLFSDRLYTDGPVTTDEENRIRLDDYEMRQDIQQEVQRRWEAQREGQPLIFGDLEGVRQEYDQIHGFGWPDVDYSKDVDPREV